MPEYGLRARDRGPVNPSGAEYCRRIGLDDTSKLRDWSRFSGSDELEEILVVGTVVIWTSGNVLRKAFNFAEDGQHIRQALFAHFPSPQSLFKSDLDATVPQMGADTQAPSRVFALDNALKSTANMVHQQHSTTHHDPVRALVVILDEILYVYHQDGRSDVVNLPFLVDKAFARAQGLVLERSIDIDEFPKGSAAFLDDIPRLFSLQDPLDHMGVVLAAPDASTSLRHDDELCFVSEEFLVTKCCKRKSMSIWRVTPQATKEPEAPSDIRKNSIARRRSSMRVSTSGLSKLDGMDDEKKAPTSQPDLSVHLDRTLFADVDPSTLFDEPGKLRKDILLTHLSTYSVACDSSKPEVICLNITENTQLFYILAAQDQKLLEISLRRSKHGKITLTKFSDLSAKSIVRIKLASIESVLILKTDCSVVLRTPECPDIAIQLDHTPDSLLTLREADFLCHTPDGLLRQYQLIPDEEDGFCNLVLCMLRSFMTVPDYWLFNIARWANMSFHHDISPKQALFITILACFLDPSHAPRITILEDSTSLDTDTTILDLIGRADVLCRQHDLSSLRRYLSQIILSLHFAALELSLNIFMARDCLSVVPVLIQLTTWTRWAGYVSYYTTIYAHPMGLAIDDDLEYLSIPEPVHGPPSMLIWCRSLFDGRSARFVTWEASVLGDQFNSAISFQEVHDKSVCERTFMLCQVYPLLMTSGNCLHELVPLMMDLQFTTEVLQSLPLVLALPLKDVLNQCSLNPSSDWNSASLSLVGRQDLAAFLDDNAHSTTAEPSAHETIVATKSTEDAQVDDSLQENSSADLLAHSSSDHHEVTRLIFEQDRRIQEVEKMLACDKVTSVQWHASEHLGEAEQIREQESLACLVSIRTLAVPLGRAIYQFDVQHPSPTTQFPMTRMNFDIKIRPAQVTVSEQKNFITASLKTWPLFHNGVAAGLSISREAQEISASWIVFNRPSELSDGHAGFLLGLGLNGHLKAIATWHAFNYLTSKHSMTSIGLLLGLSASFLGTMDPMVTKLLSVHILALLPPGSNELNLSDTTQAAGVVGIGLLHFSTGNRRMSEIMLAEIACEDSSAEKFRDESYRLSAGLALGMINAGQGTQRSSTRDNTLVPTLIGCIKGNTRERHDLDLKMAGAIVALGLVYLRTNNEYIAGTLVVPDTRHELEGIRPDLFLIRTLARGLIMWDSVEPTSSYIAQLLPRSLRSLANLNHVMQHDSRDLVLFNIIVGACLSIGMKFAGSQETGPRDFVLTYMDKFIKICNFEERGVDHKANRIAVRTLLGVLCFASTMIMAGSGDLQVLRRLRRLHYRLESDTWYGNYMATEMSIGLLFMGGGHKSLTCSNLSICSFVAAFYPILPNTTEDNRSHLQALRHLWVLGAESRCLVPRSTVSGGACLAPIRIEYNSRAREAQVLMAPCLLPPLEAIRSISIDEAEFWPVRLALRDSTRHFNAFKKNQSIYVTRRTKPMQKDFLVDVTVNGESDEANPTSGISRDIQAVLGPSFAGLETMMSQAVQKDDARLWEILSDRAILRNLVRNQGQTGLQSVSLLLSYWQATYSGPLSGLFRGGAERSIDEPFIQQLQLDLWQNKHMEVEFT